MFISNFIIATMSFLYQIYLVSLATKEWLNVVLGGIWYVWSVNDMYFKEKFYLFGGLCLAIKTQQTRYIDPMLGWCRRRWTNISPTFGLRGVFSVNPWVYKFEKLSLSYDKPMLKCALKRSFCHVLITHLFLYFYTQAIYILYARTVPGITYHCRKKKDKSIFMLLFF